MKRRIAMFLATALAVGAAACLLEAAYIKAKAAVAQLLIKTAWSEALERGSSPVPWPWADTYPVARLGWPDEGEDVIVLQGGSGRTLAFGPGHVAGTPEPGEAGNVVIGGHRDTHFAFLRRLRKGDRLLLEAPNGELLDYVVRSLEVVDRTDASILSDRGDDRLTLVTCYPFDAVRPGGPLRYVVTALRTGPPPLDLRTAGAP